MQRDEIRLHDDIQLRLAWSVSESAEQMLVHLHPGSTIVRREGGKPDLMRHDGRLLACSITHTQGFSAVCWAESGEIGVDAERLDRQVHPGLAARMRHPEDDIRLESDPITAWIIKESVLKCIGTGLRLGMNKIAVRFESPERFVANWNGHTFHGILLSRHTVRLSIVHTTSPL